MPSSVLLKEGFTPMTTPDLARQEVLQGIGFIPRGPETQIYSIESSDLSLVATAEITLGGLLSGQTIDAEELPLKLCGVSHCFRTEAGAAGKASRGLYRVHQFTKVEMFAYTVPGESDDMLEYLRDMECRIFDGLGVPYRVVDTATGDLGGPAYRKFDLEAWMPGRGDFGEVTSTSNCTDYQARRLNIRYRVKGEKGTRFVHTLNGTAIAISRGLIAVMENSPAGRRLNRSAGSVAGVDGKGPDRGEEVAYYCNRMTLSASSQSCRASSAVGASAIARTIGSVLLPRTSSQRSGQSRRSPSMWLAAASRK